MLKLIDVCIKSRSKKERDRGRLFKSMYSIPTVTFLFSQIE